MTVTQTLGTLGSWEVQLRDETPDEIKSQLGFFGHIAIADGIVDVAAVGDGLLTGARYVGVLRSRDKDTGRTIAGSGMVFWLGDEDGKGDILETQLNLSGLTLSAAVTALLGPSNAVTVGTVTSVAGTMPANSKYQFLSRREVLQQVCDAFDVEFRVNGNATVDVGPAWVLYNTANPDTIIVRKGAGSDMNLVALGGEPDVGEHVHDYSTKAILLGQTVGTGDTPDVVFATGSATAASVPYLNLRGNTVKQVRTISESGTTSGSVSARAQLALNRFNRVARSLKVTAEEFEVAGNFVVGDNVWVYDPDTGIVNATYEVTFRGEVLHPDVVRASGITWPVVRGMTVAFRTQAGVWLDLTPFVTWETGGNELTVGDLPKSLTKPTDNTVQVRLDAVRADASIPNPPTGLTLTTFSTLNAQGQTGAVIHASWTAPSLNTDGTVITDLSHYVIQYHWTGRPSVWQEAPATADTARDLIVTPGLPYEVRVAAVDLGGKLSAWTATSAITSAADAIAPNPPADPVVTSYYGQLRIEYAGTDSTGNPMATDTNRIDVHVSATSGFTPSTATRVDSITPFAKGVSYATAPYGVTRYVKLVAVDHSGNPSASSGQVSGASTWISTPDYANLSVTNAIIADLSVGKLTAGTMSADVTISGRFTTALTGARTELNSVGLQMYDASSNLLVNITPSGALLTGVVKTALSGRRIEIGASGALGEINLYAPDGARAYVRAFTQSSGIEAAQFGLPIANEDFFWNKIHFNSDEWVNLRARRMDLIFLSPEDGFFAVRHFAVRGTGQASTTRIFIDADETVLRDNIGQVRVYILSAGTGITRFFQGSPSTAGYTEWLNGAQSGSAFTTSAKLRLTTPQVNGTGGIYQSLFQYAVNLDGTNGGFECRTGDNSGFIPIKASAFTVNSDMRTKTDITDTSLDALALLNSVKVRDFRRVDRNQPRRPPAAEPKNPDADDQEQPPPVVVDEQPAADVVGPVEVGVLAQEMPERVRVVAPDGSVGFDMAQVQALQTRAIQQLAARLAAVERRGPAL